MRKQGLHRRGGAALLALLLAMACFTVSVLAREDIDLDRSSSISVYFGSGSRGFSGVDFSLYRVADVSESGEYALTGDFRRYNVSLDGLDSSGWRALAQTLDAYAARDGLDRFRKGRPAQAAGRTLPGCVRGFTWFRASGTFPAGLCTRRRRCWCRSPAKRTAEAGTTASR